MIEAVDSIEAVEPVDDEGDVDEKMSPTARWIIEESVCQNGAKNGVSKVAFCPSETAFWGLKSGFLTLSNGFFIFQTVDFKAQKHAFLLRKFKNVARATFKMPLKTAHF